jgi:PAS domain S-box-containing protein
MKIEDPLAEFESADGMFSVDGSQRITGWSASAERLLGYSAEEVLGQPCYEVVGGSDSLNYRFCRRNCPVVLNARRGRMTPDYDVLTRAKDGSSVWINMSVLLIRREKATPPQLVHVFREVTERRRVEGLMRRSVQGQPETGEASAVGGGIADPRLPPPPSLSRRELQVLQLLAAGMETAQIGQQLGVSPVTARNHITRLVTKLGVRSRLQAVLYASRRNLI